MFTMDGWRWRWVVGLVWMSALQACFASRPAQNVGFGRATTLQDLEGTYVNQGEVREGSPSMFLSTVIWPKDPSIEHETIATIEVDAEGDTVVNVRAKDGAGNVFKESSFRRGEQFDLQGGRIRLSRRSQGVAPKKDGEVFLGAVTETVELGIDARGDAKFKTSATMAGLVFLVVPIVGGESTEVRFRRLRK